MNIEEKIRFIRESNYINKKNFAEILEVSQPTVTRLESGQREPDLAFLQKLFKTFRVNPSWFFFDTGVPFLESLNDEANILDQNLKLFLDVNLVLNQDEVTRSLNQILIENSIKLIASDNPNDKSIIRKFLDTIRLENHIPFRPMLFLYYIFRYVQDNSEELNEIQSYKEYLIDLVKRYKVYTFKNNPGFTSEIKKQFIGSIELNLQEEDCKRLIQYYDIAIKALESNMKPIMVIAHRKIDTKALFPEQ